jgi:cobalamin biosynthetic protein CobC
LLKHGGKIIEAAHKYNIAVDQWLDLSTGLNPHPWLPNMIPVSAWSRLPDEDDELDQAARDYYGGETVLSVAGSQAAIQALPRLRNPASRIAIFDPAYAEHAHAWQVNGFSVTPVSAMEIDHVIHQHDVILLINPNNPTGECFSLEQCLSWHQQLSRRGGWLIVDEAFIDCTPEHSLVNYSHLPGLIVLRSLGKFFGLAGARVGFVFTEQTLLKKLADLLGPWPISGASRYIATMALHDKAWQLATRKQLKTNEPRLQQLLSKYNLKPDGGTTLFQWIKIGNATSIYQQLAQQGILTRLFEKPASLRFGLPATEQQWSRLEQALASLVINNNIIYEAQQ